MKNSKIYRAIPQEKYDEFFNLLTAMQNNLVENRDYTGAKAVNHVQRILITFWYDADNETIYK